MADQNQQAGQNQQQQQQNQQQNQQPVSIFEDLRGKKGFKDNDAFAKSYTEIEQSYAKTHNAFNSAKQNVEALSQGNYTLDEKGTTILTEKGQQAQQQQQYGNQGQNNQQYGNQQYQQAQAGRSQYVDEQCRTNRAA